MASQGRTPSYRTSLYRTQRLLPQDGSHRASPESKDDPALRGPHTCLPTDRDSHTWMGLTLPAGVMQRPVKVRVRVYMCPVAEGAWPSLLENSEEPGGNPLSLFSPPACSGSSCGICL